LWLYSSLFWCFSLLDSYNTGVGVRAPFNPFDFINDQEYAYFLYNFPKEINATTFRESDKLPVNYNFNEGLIDISNNFIEGMSLYDSVNFTYRAGAYPFEFYSPQFPSNFSNLLVPLDFHYNVRLRYNRYDCRRLVFVLWAFIVTLMIRMKLTPRFLPLPHVFAKRNLVFLNEILIDSVINPQDANECVERTHKCDQICADGWFPLLSYTVWSAF
jgi:hypothetical protein